VSRRLANRSPLALLAALALGLLLIAPAAASAAHSSAAFPYCSWWAKTTPETLNVAFPDSAATYWTTPFYAEEDVEIELEAQYPHARYMSFNVYDEADGSFETNGVSSGLADYEIAPDAGSVNPFQTKGEAGGSFAVTLSGAAKPGDVNTLPLAPEGEAGGERGAPLGFILYRVYLPTGGNATVPLPRLTLVRNGKPVTLPRCPTPTGNPIAKLQGKRTGKAIKALLRLGKALDRGSDGTTPCRGSECPPPLKFFRASAAATNAFFPNVDNAYVSAIYRPPAGKVVVVRGKAATTPSGTSPVPWPEGGLQLRYWSLCNNVYRSPWPVVANAEAGGGTEYGCVADYETRLNAAGEYAFVVARPSQRAAVQAAGGTFIPLSSSEPLARQILIFRNMLPNESFTHAVQDAPQDAEPISAAKAMGAYYPRAYRCTMAEFEASSPACG
jgi:hypothetical protein